MSETFYNVLPYSFTLGRTLKKTYIDTLMATQDNEAHRFEVSLFKDNEPLDLTGAAVSAYFIRYSDNVTIFLSGEASGSVASTVLKKACYNKPGQFALIIKISSGTVINAVFYGEGTIFASSTDSVMDEENIIPSLDDLLAQIATIEAATNAANTAAGNANTAAGSANTAAGNANTAAAKIDGMTVSAEKADDADAVISEVNGVKHIAFKLPKGDKGDKGDPGTIENVTITSIAGLEDALAGKLPTDGTAADSEKLGGVAADQYMLKTDTAADSEKLGGVAADGYVLHTDALTLEEIEASTDLAGKVASAEAAYELSKKGSTVDVEAYADAVPTNTWTIMNTSYTLDPGTYLLNCHFFRDQGGDDTVFWVGLGLNAASTYDSDAMLGGMSTNWGSVSVGARLFSVTETTTYNLFVKHKASAAHKIDIRATFIRL